MCGSLILVYELGRVVSEVRSLVCAARLEKMRSTKTILEVDAICGVSKFKLNE